MRMLSTYFNIEDLYFVYSRKKYINVQRNNCLMSVKLRLLKAVELSTQDEKMFYAALHTHIIDCVKLVKNVTHMCLHAYSQYL